MIALIACCAKEEIISQGYNGFVVDKMETNDHYYILLDTDYWVQIEEGDYIGLDTGDFYEEN